VGLHKGALWLSRGIVKLFRGVEFMHSMARAGVTCISQIFARATVAMQTDTKLTKTKSRRTLSYLSDWFQQLITAKEMDLDGLAGQNLVKGK
jgi:hypothetical protein